MKRYKPAIWLTLCLLFSLTAVLLWRQNLERRVAESSGIAPRRTLAVPTPSAPVSPIAPAAPQKRAQTVAASLVATIPAREVDARTAHFHATEGNPHRLSNTRRSFDDLIRRDRSILLRNAFIDTAATLRGLPIPPELQAGENAGAWLVQSAGRVSPDFLKLLRDSGARFSESAYIPNNTYVVRAEKKVVDLLRASPLVSRALPYEPFYKLDSALLDIAINRQPPPPGGRMRVTLFPGERDAAVAAIRQSDTRILAEEETPFGPSLIVHPDIATWTGLAMMPEVQGLERHRNKVLMNDLTRVQLNVSTNVMDPANYLGLTGTNVTVYVNDHEYLDVNHPDLTTNRASVISPYTSTNDYGGHATFVAGIIASSGASSPTVMQTGDGSTNIHGSYTGSDFRGMAPEASIVMMDFDDDAVDVNGAPTEAELSEIPARTNLYVLGKTNTAIINNSWGYQGAFTYDTTAAIWDARVRDAIPTHPGLQQTMPVFAAGNDGLGNESGSDGLSDRISSPATAKNVITVGSSEQYRRITNEFLIPAFTVTNTCITNMAAIYLGRTDSSNEVAGYSSRGNIDPQDEGEFGRFKPDVVAPGTFPVSLRSTDWNHTNRYLAGNVDYLYVYFTNIVIAPDTVQTFFNFIPFNATNLFIDTLDNRTGGALELRIHTNSTPNPAANAAPAGANLAGTNRINIPIDNMPQGPGAIYIDVENTNAGVEIGFDLEMIITITNCAGEYDMVLSNLNERVGPHNTTPQGRYRFATGGTSYSAPAVSGMLALLQDFFEGTNVLTDPTLRRTNSAAMMKAVLINSARSLGQTYDYDMRSQINYQGWGQPSLVRMIAPIMATEPDDTRWPIQMRDMTGTNSLATDWAHAYGVTVAPEVTNVPLRVTLTWSDPPGNPNAAAKLVNDLDVILSNNVTGDIFRGNTFDGDGEFSKVVGATNDFIDPVTGMPIPIDLPTNDVVNNVENIYVNAPVEQSYTLFVIGSRVNVNAVPAHTNEIVQDYALVVSSANGDFAGGLTIDDFPTLITNYSITNEPHRFTFIDPGDTNAAPTPGQRAGANSPLAHDSTTPLLVATNGMTNQWVFFHVTNSAGGSNAAFITFRPDNLSIPRNKDGDVDLYVSTSSTLTNLDTTAIAGATKSLSRGGSEVITFSNSVAGDEYFVGVKSEDQQAVDFGFFAIFTDDRFADRDSQGNVSVYGIGDPTIIPDGTPQMPGGTNVFMINPYPIDIRRVIVTNSLTHQLMGDLVGELEHDGVRATIINHRGDDARLGLTYIHDDSTQNDIDYPAVNFAGFPPFYDLGGPATPTDGPQRLGNFTGQEGVGFWTYTVSDNQLLHTGTVDGISIRLEPANGTNSIAGGNVGDGRTNTVRGMSTFCDFTYVPPGAVLLSINVEFPTALAGPLNMYVRRGQLPTTNTYDHFAVVQPPGGSLQITVSDVPALNPGQYFVCLENTNVADVEFVLTYDIEIDFGVVPKLTQFSANQMEILDDVRTNGVFAQIPVSLNRQVAGVRAGIRIAHERASDVSVRLVSPTGSDVLLTENRGYWSTNGYGYGTNVGEIAYVAFSENPDLADTPIKFITNEAFMSFTPPKVLATNYLEDTGWTLNTDTTSGGSNESVFLLPVGLNAGNITIDYNFFSQPDRLQIYERSLGVLAPVPGGDTGVASSLQDMFTFTPAQVDTAADTITVTGHTYVDGDRVVLVNPTFPGVGGSASAQLPGGIVHTEFYLVRNVVGDTFELENETTSIMVDITTQGTGTHSIWGKLPAVNRSFTIPYTTTDGLLEIVVNQGSGSPGTVWDYSFTLNPDPGTFPNANQVGAGIAAYDGRIFVAGATDARAENGVVAQFSTPMLDDSKPFYSLNWPDLRGGTRFNDVAATAAGIFAVGNSYTLTEDPDVPLLGITEKQAKMVVARFPFDDPAISVTNVQGSDFYAQIPATGEGMFYPHQNGAASNYANEEEAHGIVAANENGTDYLYIVGSAAENAANAGRMTLSKMDTSGAFLFHTNDLFNMVGNGFSAGYDVAVRGTNVFVAGVNADSGTSNPYLMALDTNGVPQWTWTTNEIGQLNAVTTLNDHVYAVGVIEALAGGNANAYLVKIDFSGNVVWTRTYDFAGANREDFFNGILPFGNRVYAVGAAANSTVPISFSDITAGGMDPPGGMAPGMAADATISVPHDQVGAEPPQTNIRFTHNQVGVAFNGITVRFLSDPAITTDSAVADFGVTTANTLTIRFGNGFTTPATVLTEINANTATLNFTAAYQGVNNPTTPIFANVLTFDHDATIYEVNEAGDLVTIPSAGYNGITVFSGEGNGSDEQFRDIVTDGFDVYVTGLVNPISAARGDEVLLLRYSVKEDILPEESLNEFIGESSGGNWRLEIWDDRAGGDTNLAPQLISWQLQFDLTVTNLTPFPLTHGNALTNTVSGTDVRYFIVHVPYTATQADIQLRSPTGGPLDLWFNQYGLPFTGVGSDYLFMPDDVGAAGQTYTFRSDGTTTPLLVPGQRFFLALVNDPTTATNDFEIVVTFDSTATTFAARTGGPVSGGLAASSGGSTPQVDQYQFNVYTGEPRVHFDVKDLSGDVRVRLRRGAIPNSASYDFELDIVGSNYSRTTIEPGAGLPLIEGAWFASIENIGATAASYDIEIVGENAAPVLDPISDFAMNEGGTLNFAATATDPNTPLTYTLQAAPPGATIGAQNGVFNWTPTEAQGPAVHTVTLVVTDNGAPKLSATQTFNVTVAEVNQAPVLPAFGNLVINEGDTLAVPAGAIEYDIPANALSYRLASAPNGATINPATGAISWTAGETHGGATYLFDVVVTDDGSPAASASGSFQVAVAELNSAPVIEAIEDLAILELDTLRITNVVTDADIPANALLFALEAGAPAGMTIDPLTGVIDWTPTESQGPGVYQVGVVVTDNGAPVKSAIERFKVTVLEKNQAPVLEPLGDLVADEGELVSLIALATDADLPAQGLTFSLAGAPAGMTIDAGSGAIEWTPTEAQGPADYTFLVVVTDDAALPASDSETVTITVNEVNSPPVVTPITSVSVAESMPIAFQATAIDPDLPANSLTFSFSSAVPTGATLDPVTGDFAWTPSEAQGPGSYMIAITATDNGVPALAGTAFFTVTVGEINEAPVLTPLPVQNVVEKTSLGFRVPAADVDLPANKLTFSLEPGAPAGLSINASVGQVSWRPLEHNGPKDYSFDVRVTDNGNPVLNDVQTYHVRVLDGNTAPVLSPIGGKSIPEEQTLSFTATATDSDQPADTMTYSLEPGAPAGAAIDPASGLFTWTPSEAQGLQIYTVGIRVTDSGVPAMSDTRTFTISVGDVNRPPTLAPIPDAAVSEGQQLLVQLSATDPDIPANSLIYRLEPGAPAGASLNPISGRLSWTPTESQGPATHTIGVRVGDSQDPELSDVKTFDVVVGEVNTAPVLEPIGDLAFDEGGLMRIDAAATDVDLPANRLTFSLDPGAPTGMTVDSVTGVIDWTPDETVGPDEFTITVRVTDDGEGALDDSETLTISIREVNAEPVLAPIGDLAADELQPLAFTASASDADLPANTFSFSLVGAPAGASIDPVSGQFAWTPSEQQGPGVHTFQVVVTDNGAPVRSASETISVTVGEVNVAPAISGISDPSVDENATLSLQIPATDADVPANGLSFTLEPGAPDGMAIDAASGLVTWTPGESLGGGNFPVTVRVTDDGSGALSGTRSFTVHVIDRNSAPVLVAIPEQSVEEGAALGLTVSASDSDEPADALTFSLDPGAPAGMTINPDSGALAWTPSENQGPAKHAVTVRVTDNGEGALSDTVTFEVTVREGNTAPDLAAISDQTVREGETLSVTAVATDADEPVNIISYRLESGSPAGMTINAGTGLISWTPTEAQGPGSYSVSVRATDDGAGQLSDIETFTVTVSEVNRAPTLAAIDNRSIDEGAELSLNAAATDPDQPANVLTYSLASGAPAGASTDPASGAFRWTPAETDGGQSFAITIVVTDDGEGSLQDTEVFVVTVRDVNSPPAVTSIPDRTVAETERLTVAVSASDADVPADTLAYSLAPGAPAGMTIDPATGEIGWTPTEAQGPGVYPVTVVVRDNGAGALASETGFSVTVTEANTAPVLAAIGNASVAEGQPLAFVATASDVDEPADGISFSLAPGAPEGAVIDPETGAFAWTPGEADGPGSFEITIVATDDGEGALSDSETIVVTVTEVNESPVLGALDVLELDEGSSLAQAVPVTDADLPANALTFSLAPGAPAGVAIDPVTGVLSWTPTEAQGPATHEVTVVVTDDGEGALSDSRTYSLRVIEVNVAPVLEPIAAITVDEGEPATFTATASDIDSPANGISYSLAAGAPSGASIDPASGAFNWTPSEAQGPGDFVVRVIATDDGSPALSVAREVAIRVNEVNDAPRLLAIASQTVIECADLSIVVFAFDDDRPAQQLTFSLGEGAPEGAAIDPVSGILTFRTPPGTGSHEITVIVTDNGTPAKTASRTFTVTHNPLPLSVVTLADATANEGVADDCNSFKRFFKFTIPATANRALFELYDLTADADLLLRKGDLPSASLFDAASSTEGAASEKIVVPLAGVGADIAGDWYVAVRNRSAGKASFKVRATVPAIVEGGSMLISGDPIELETAPIVSATENPTLNFPTIRGEKYVVEISDNLIDWTVLTEIVVTDSNTSVVDPTPFLTQTRRFYRIRQVPQ